MVEFIYKTIEIGYTRKDDWKDASDWKSNKITHFKRFVL